MKYLLAALLLLLAPAAVRGADSNNTLPGEFYPAVVGVSGKATAFAVLAAAFEKGSLPERKDVEKVLAGRAFGAVMQNTGVNFYLVGRQIYFSVIVEDKNGFGHYRQGSKNPQFSVLPVYSRVGSETLEKLLARLKKREEVIAPMAAENGALVTACSDSPDDRFFIRKFGGLLVVRHEKKGRVADYAYLAVRLDREKTGLSAEDFTEEAFNEAE